MPDIHTMLALVAERKYLALGLLAVYTVVRLLRDDARFLPDLQGRYRAVAALALGVFAGVLERLDSGVDMRTAIASGLALGALAVFGHFLGVDVLRGGRELPLPAFLRKPEPPQDPPPPAAGVSKVPGPFIVTLWAMIMALAGCASGSPLPKFDRAARDDLARHGLAVAGCYRRGEEAGTLPDGGKSAEAGLAVFDECVDGGAK